jgi:DNA-binding response OmpR family regulator
MHDPSSGPSSSLSVLVVEDDAVFGEILEALFLDHGYHVHWARTVSQAVQMSNEQTFSAALLDVHVGNELVFELADQLRDQSVPYVFMSGPFIDVLPQSHAGVSLVRKPLRLKDLLSAVDRLTVKPHHLPE